jgi:isoleucyl-tRNA synthetase
MLSPILAFTTDEAWELIPGKVGSVHETAWQPMGLIRPSEEATFWGEMFALRDILLLKLEEKRKGKVIGKSLEAKIHWFPERAKKLSDLVSDGKILEEFRELVNVSQFEITNDPKAELVVHADGKKCERCWHWETDVGSHKEHPTICGRCIAAVKEFQAGR